MGRGASSLKISVLQMTSDENVEQNVLVIQGGLAQAKEQGSEILFCPENSLYFRCSDQAPMRYLTLDHSGFAKLAEEARRLKITLHLGSVPLVMDGAHWNCSVTISASGQIAATYSKIHLFDISLENHQPLRESANFNFGQELVILNYKGWKIGQSICYDVRFSELYAQYAAAEVDVLLVPAAFLVRTGKVHWDVLLRARAIESQCYVVAAAQSGVHKSEFGQRETFGHSQIVNPWGEVQTFEESEVGVIHSTLDPEACEKVRRQIPMASHRRVSRGRFPIREVIIA